METQYASIGRRSYNNRIKEINDHGCTKAYISYTSSGVYVSPNDPFKNIRHSYILSNLIQVITNGVLHNKKTSDNIPFRYIKTIYRVYI